ncbi:hypothetical protein AJ80_06154 [Polytolypa hystricis UAMH7299]|uniref:Domain of unknown function at the cortex 1 domain-containing protein n=1 Tax=Polytolypa hystricis (strain UAMH7299) TaxID=1447883 RepID=A0A2B7XY64_POLH7|nr:hypothetical protein AJ80_06154 [Polytolypa hystricis UAMH7299]
MAYDPQYRLRVTCGPSYDPSTHNLVAVNANTSHVIDTAHARVELCVRIQDYTAGLPPSSPRTCSYFTHPLHTTDQYSISIHLTPKHPIPGPHLLFGNDFDRPIRDRLPPGTNYALKLVKWTIDPGLEVDAYADRPYMYGPALSSWNYLRVCGRVGEEEEAIKAGHGASRSFHDEIIEEGGEGSGLDIRRLLDVPDDAAARKHFFLDEANREMFEFERGRVYKADFGNPYLGFSDFSLRLPGFSLPVAKYIDEKNHELRYVLKNKETDDIYFVLLFTLLLEEDCGSEGSGEDDGQEGKGKGEVGESEVD